MQYENIINYDLDNQRLNIKYLLSEHTKYSLVNNILQWIQEKNYNFTNRLPPVSHCIILICLQDVTGRPWHESKDQTEYFDLSIWGRRMFVIFICKEATRQQKGKIVNNKLRIHRPSVENMFLLQDIRPDTGVYWIFKIRPAFL